MSFEIQVEKKLGDHRITLDLCSNSHLVALFGPSGIGKTSILNMVAGLLRPDRGRIAVDSQTMFDSSSKVDLAPEERGVGYIFQDARLFPHKRVRANLLYGHDLTTPERRWITLDEVVAFLGIAPLLDRWPRSLSGGEAQRVAIGRALLAGPRLLLMDEPLSSLDAPRREEILTVIERIRDELRVPILYVTHDRTEIDRLAAEIMPLKSSAVLQ